ncbi:MAG: hypothetical protein ACRBBQ_07625 [Cognatishimia sp.]
MRNIAILLSTLLLAACVGGPSTKLEFPPIGGYTATTVQPPVYSGANAAPENRIPGMGNIVGDPKNGVGQLVKVADEKALKRAGKMALNHGHFQREESAITIDGEEFLMRRTTSRGYDFMLLRQKGYYRRGDKRSDRWRDVIAAVVQATGCKTSGNAWTRRHTNGKKNEYSVHIDCR